MVTGRGNLGILHKLLANASHRESGVVILIGFPSWTFAPFVVEAF
jgi:hypothetical protein